VVGAVGRGGFLRTGNGRRFRSVGFSGRGEVVMNLFSVGLKDQPGELAHPGEVCAQRGVNLQLAGVVTGERGHSQTRLSARSRCVPSACALVAGKGGT
jgi:hypothetical protein